ncbi:hypothetical protein VPH35_095885 [Triticum aestivum]|uniref:DUF4220 domain-containing protein n=1 Tax=Aegilops tauschii TaxID=37682 RepID=M8BF43_AEGTA
MVDSWIEKDPENHNADKLRALKKQGYEVMWTMMEVQLSLMYDILYTKAAVLHTWPGYCIRDISPLTTAASFLLFHFSGKDGNHSGLDVVVTYTLLSGAFLETTSLLSALGSTWTYAFLCATKWSWLRYAALRTGRWSGKIGQYNMLHRCARRDTAFSPLLGRLANMVGEELKEWWDRKHYSGTIEISDYLMEKISKYIAQLQLPDSAAGLAQTRLYQRTCLNLVDIWKEDEHPSPFHPNRLKELFRVRDGPNSSGLTQRDELATIIYDKNPGYNIDVPRIKYAWRLTEKLLVIQEGRSH